MSESQMCGRVKPRPGGWTVGCVSADTSADFMAFRVYPRNSYETYLHQHIDTEPASPEVFVKPLLNPTSQKTKYINVILRDKVMGHIQQNRLHVLMYEGSC